MKRAGVELERPPGTPTPCKSCPKIPKGAVPRPENAVVISGRNFAAYRYYLQCRVDPTGVLPRDRLVIRNNALIHWLEESLQRANANLAPILLSMFAAKGK